MNLDNEGQRTNLKWCIQTAAATFRFDASDASLAQCAVLTKLRQEVDAASVGAEIIGEADLPYLEPPPNA